MDRRIKHVFSRSFGAKPPCQDFKITVEMVYTVDMAYTVDMVYAVDIVYTVPAHFAKNLFLGNKKKLSSLSGN